MHAPRLWQVWLAAGAVAAAGSLVLSPGSPARALLFPAFGAFGVAGLVWGIRRNRPAQARAWQLIVAGQSLTALGNLLWAYLANVAHSDPRSSFCDVFFLLAYVPMSAGLIMLVRGRTAGRDRSGTLDATIISVGVALLAWAVFLRPVALDSHLDVATRLLELAYPVIDIFLAALLIRLLSSPGSRSGAFHLLSGALILMLGADLVFGVIDLLGLGDSRVASLLWLLSSVCVGATGLHPGMAQLAGQDQPPSNELGRVRFAGLAVAAMLPPVLLVVAGLRDPHDIDWMGIAAGCLVLFPLVLARMSDLHAGLRRQSDRLRLLATLDGLTGVPNRRSWDQGLAAALDEADGQPVDVVLLDLDFFKAFNDAYGHQGGDRLLKEAAAAWTGCLRPDDLLARYGGEEFGLLITGHSAARTVQIVERLRMVMPLGQTFSAGVARWDGAESPERLVARADQALYRAKQQGRDRTVVDNAEPLPVLDARLSG